MGGGRLKVVSRVISLAHSNSAAMSYEAHLPAPLSVMVHEFCLVFLSLLILTYYTLGAGQGLSTIPHLL